METLFGLRGAAKQRGRKREATVAETLERLGEEGFLTGDIERVPEIHDVFAKLWNQILADARRYEPEVLRELDWRDAVKAAFWLADAGPDYAFQVAVGGIALLGPLMIAPEATTFWLSYVELNDAAWPKSVFTAPALTGMSHAPEILLTSA